MSSTYSPAADSGDHEHVLVHNTSNEHYVYGTHIGYLTVGTPGAEKGNNVYRPLFHITLPDEGKLEADVTWAKLWVYIYGVIGDPSAKQWSLSRCSQYNWYDYYTHDSACADYTCDQHTAHSWPTVWGDPQLPTTIFYGPPYATEVWFSIDCTDHLKDAITNHTRDLNLIMAQYMDASAVSWDFICKHAGGIWAPYKWYVEVEWTAAAGDPALAAAAQVL